jgi:hypothetical protein
MSIESIADAIQNTQMFTAVRESMLVYPIVLSTHLTMIAVFGGLILMTDLRLLGVALTSVPVSQVIRGTRPWKWVGLLIMLTCGVLLGGAKLGTYYDNPYFVIKMSLLLLVGVHALVFRKTVYGNPEKLDAMPVMPTAAKAAGVLSLVLWLSIMSCGRWIAYWESPADAPGGAARQQVMQQR